MEPALRDSRTVNGSLARTPLDPQVEEFAIIVVGAVFGQRSLFQGERVGSGTERWAGERGAELVGVVGESLKADEAVQVSQRLTVENHFGDESSCAERLQKRTAGGGLRAAWFEIGGVE